MMPLFDISASDAIEARKNNPYATWGERSKPNRMEPVAKPAFDAPFQLQPGEAIFTVGSCFARNVEMELMKYGFEVPMRELFKKPEFTDMEPGFVNNFGTPSIYNEFAWALGERPFVPEDHLIEVLDGKYADMHVIPSIRPQSWDVVMARRNGIMEAFRTVRDCRVAIMTLGLVEVWYDTETGHYLNATPRPALLRREPDRFRMHVLSFEEVYRYLNDALLLIRKYGRADVRVILTVSPVPLMLTHRNQDVIVANTYSKSVLRAAAETAIARHDFVTYFPSYESCILTDRKIAWCDDLVHVTDAIVAVNIGRMFDAFVPHDSSTSSYRSDIAVGGTVVAIEWARKMCRDDAADAEAFFREFGSLSATSVEFAIEHAQFLLNSDDCAAALAILDDAGASMPDARLTIAAAEILIKVGRPHEAFERMASLAGPQQRSHAVWHTLMECAKATGDPERVLDVMQRHIAATPRRAGRIRALVGRWYQSRREHQAAMPHLEEALRIAEDDHTARLFYAEALMHCGRANEARHHLGLARPATPSEHVLAKRLALRLANFARPQETTA